MKAVILAAGKGTRMRELTNEIPKPMLTNAALLGKPILEHILEGLIGAGIREVFIVTGFKAETIEQYFGDGTKWNARIAYGRQVVQDGTGKAPELAKSFVGSSTFLLTYGDILVRPETYQHMVHRFNEGHFSGVITVTGSEDVTKGGLVFFDDAFCLRRLVEKPGPDQLEQLHREGWLQPGDTAWYNAGIVHLPPLPLRLHRPTRKIAARRIRADRRHFRPRRHPSRHRRHAHRRSLGGCPRPRSPRQPQPYRAGVDAGLSFVPVFNPRTSSKAASGAVTSGLWRRPSGWNSEFYLLDF